MSLIKSNSIYLIDIGNASTSIARMDSHGIHDVTEYLDDDLPKSIPFLDRSGGRYMEKGIICSVVPEIEHKMVGLFRKYKGFTCHVLGKDVPIGIRSRYKHYGQLGNDRKVNVWGAVRRMKPPLVIFDFGTATTVDYVSRKGVFEGGLILPGLKTALDVLYEKTALLPKVRIRHVRRFLGRDTEACMLSGVLYGYGAMVRGLIREFRRRFGKGIKTVGTGGLVDIVEKYSGPFDLADRFLTLRAMGHLYREWESRRPARSVRCQNQGE